METEWLSSSSPPWIGDEARPRTDVYMLISFVPVLLIIICCYCLGRRELEPLCHPLFWRLVL